MAKDLGLFGSSVNPAQLAMTFKGILVAIIPAVLFVAKLKGWDLGEADLTNFVDGMTYAVGAIGTAVGALITLYGLYRKIRERIKK